MVLIDDIVTSCLKFYNSFSFRLCSVGFFFSLSLPLFFLFSSELNNVLVLTQSRILLEKKEPRKLCGRRTICLTERPFS